MLCLTNQPHLTCMPVTSVNKEIVFYQLPGSFDGAIVSSRSSWCLEGHSNEGIGRGGCGS